jgi:hypothetical protein
MAAAVVCHVSMTYEHEVCSVLCVLNLAGNVAILDVVRSRF